MVLIHRKYILKGKDIVCNWFSNDAEKIEWEREWERASEQARERW